MCGIGCDIDCHIGRIREPLLLHLLRAVRSRAVPIAGDEVSDASAQLQQKVSSPTLIKIPQKGGDINWGPKENIPAPDP